MGNCNFKEKGIINIDSDKVNINHFIFNCIIGRGAFGKVWRVTNKQSTKSYALKELSKSKIYEKCSVPCVLHEMELLSHLRHPFLINMQYAFEEKEHLYIVMDYLSGGDLRYHLTKEKRFTEEQTRFFISCLLIGLEYLHFNNIVHRDIKPENLVFDKKGYINITDLGIAKFLDKNKPITDSSGTPGYMSPEVLLNQPYDLSADFFAVGIMLYELTFGKRPYIGTNRQKIKEEIIARELNVKTDDLPEGFSSSLADLINSLCKRKNSMRLGNKGIHQVKDHEWFKSVDWVKLYQKEIESPFIPKIGDNFDKVYCNKKEPLNKAVYGSNLKKANSEYNFKSFYFNFSNRKENNEFFEYENAKIVFVNVHEVNIENNSLLAKKGSLNATLHKNTEKNEHSVFSNKSHLNPTILSTIKKNVV